MITARCGSVLWGAVELVWCGLARLGKISIILSIIYIIIVWLGWGGVRHCIGMVGLGNFINR
jgi:hypothetical protein